MQPNVQSLHAALGACPPPPRYWVAYSGGLDSHVLLHLCARLRADALGFPPVHAVHVHHGLQRQADDWAVHCDRVCRELSIPLLILHVDARAAPGESPEEAARNARYQAIGQHMAAGDILLTAQHGDDQAETLLLQLLRGAGLAGLAGMPVRSPFPPGALLRPLLHHSRPELLDYARAQGLNWIEDPSNADLSFDRNFIRGQILPLLQKRWPGASRALARSAGHCAEALQQLNALSDDLFHATLGSDGLSLKVPNLAVLTRADQRLVLRRWLRASGFRMPSAAVLERILEEVLPAGADKMPVVAWREGEVRRYRNHLHLLPPQGFFDSTAVLPWTAGDSLKLPGGAGELRITPARPGLGLDARRWALGPVEVRFRRGGERCRLSGRGTASHALKKLFQETAVPPWLRDRAPLVYVAGELAAVADWWVTTEAEGTDFSLTWRRGNNP
ncbi:tRNA lysidine(34) synthetase TilS [Methyloterricola oryzae]|uniref:tRNA lysidine(34) synthetase TilS n=1 Tax=Methyloterricola oryzae TaxID=1495050 RepID=UPI0005EB8E9D|nr:tRNA lysidine(34) synthetase TilS [Methyloterricola oryzae]